MADAVVVLGSDGLIVWLNDAFAELMGRDRADLLGTDALSYLHPDELVRAMDGIDYAARFPGRTAVAPYRLLGGDGRWIDIELKSGIMRGPDGDHLVLVVRNGRPRRDINRALQSVAGGAPLDVTVGIVAEAIRNRWPNTAVAISIGVRGGGREVLGGPLPGLLADHAAGRLDHLGVPPVWVLAEGGVAVVDRTELPAELRAAAEDAGYEGFAVAGLRDPIGQLGCLIVWFDHTIVGRLEFRHAAAELTELLVLALDRRHQLWQLWHVANHDPLTGLLNRAGFFERLDQVVEQNQAADGTAAEWLLFIDLDGLKAVNDRGGHVAGDRLLTETAGRLRRVAGPSAEVARLGGDEFVVFGVHPRSEARQRVEALAQALVDELCRPASDPRGAASRADILVGASVGLAVGEGETPALRIVEHADAAMYRAKAAGGSCWSW
ncbi:MAG: hypothetical protein JWM47_372 [Acidimicrobiales bacterium]|nr:hypothetical protein [Acidimicrobiales bacterium]